MTDGLKQRIEKLECNAKDEDCIKKCKGEKEKSNCGFAEVFVEDVNTELDKTIADGKEAEVVCLKDLKTISDKLQKETDPKQIDAWNAQADVIYGEIKRIRWFLKALNSSRKSGSPELQGQGVEFSSKRVSSSQRLDSAPKEEEKGE